MILDAVRESGGCAVAAEESRILEAMRFAMSTEGISLCPEAAACVLAAESLLSEGRIKPHERVVLFNTGAATKYVETVSAVLPTITDANHVDYSQLV